MCASFMVPQVKASSLNVVIETHRGDGLIPCDVA
jgi:hypothetical protein